MTTTFLIGDTHFSHKNIVKFTDKDGNKIRPFDSVEEHDQALIDAINSRVGVNDKLYHLGDVCIPRRGLNLMHAIKCQNRVLIKGNHDIYKLHEYSEHFRDIRAYHVMGGERMILSHVPVHPDSLERFKVNVHAHTHANLMLDKWGKPDIRYICVSLEHTNFAPISLDEIKTIVKERGLE